MAVSEGRKKRLKLSNPREVRRTLSKIANMLLNHEIDQKTANGIAYICNIVLGCFKQIEGPSQEEGESKMKSNRQFTIQQLLRAAEITGDSERREQYLDEADKLLRKELPAGALAAAKAAGLDLET